MIDRLSDENGLDVLKKLVEMFGLRWVVRGLAEEYGEQNLILLVREILLNDEASRKT